MVENQENVHYRAASKATHSGVEVLRGEREIPRVVIDHIEYVENIEINGRTEKCAFIAYFQKGNGFAELPMVINQTNARRLTKLYPECGGYLARLKNVAVRLTSEPCRDPNGGGQTVGLRFSQLPALSESEMQKWMVEHGYAKGERKKILPPLPDEKVESCKKWLGEGHTIEELKSMYTVSDEQIKLLSNGNK
jgi:hypothetical protein